MNGWKFTKVTNKYKLCPNCLSSYKENKLRVSMENEIITISCDCGFIKLVDENNNEVNTEKRIVTIDIANVRGFTKEESEAYYTALEKIYKPTGINVMDLV